MTTDNPRAEKVAVVEEVTAKFKEADAAFITEYRGMSVGQLANLRRALKPAGGEFKVYKNTLARIGARNAGLDGLVDVLSGPAGMTFASGDIAAVAKALRDASKANPLLVIKGGSMGSTVLTAKDIIALAELPSRDTLLAMFAGALQALDLGARPAKVFFVIPLPLILPAIASGWLLAFTLSLDDLVVASFVSGPGATTLPMLVFSSVRLGLSPQINALATLMLVAVAVALLAAPATFLFRCVVAS